MSVAAPSPLRALQPRLRLGSVSGLADTWQAFWRSRLLVWAVGCVAVLLLGTDADARHAFDYGGLSQSFGGLGNVLAAPAFRWDAIWYLQIAHHGYRSAAETGFYPLYPLLIHIVSWAVRVPALAAVLISSLGGMVGLTLVWRLTELDLDARLGRTVVTLMAFGPMALFLSAGYTEPLYLALTAGTFLAARKGHWALAGSLGGLAALTRVTGVALLIPVLVLFFYGPRTDRAPRAGVTGWQPRYGFTPSVLWALLIPLGAAAFAAFLAARGFGAGATFHAQQNYHSHRMVVPVVGAWDGIVAAVHQVRMEIDGVNLATNQTQGLLQCIGLVLVALTLWRVLRILPAAYGIYVILALLIPLATPTVGDPLRGFVRYASILFPLYMCVAAWARDRGAVRTVLLGSMVLLAVFTVQFATWNLVGGLLI